MIQLEGFTFFYYLQHHSLPTLEEAQASLLPPPVPTPLPVSAETAAAASSDTNNSTGAPTSDAESSTAQTAEQEPAVAAATTAPYYVHVTVDDYLGGVADLTGELMRLAIASVGKNLHASLLSAPTAAGGSDENDDGGGGGGADFANIDRIGKLVREIKGRTCFSTHVCERGCSIKPWNAGKERE